MNDLPSDLPAYGVNVHDYSARDDDSTDDAPAIQVVLEAKRGLVTIPYVVYRIERILRVHPHARLVLADGAGLDQRSFRLISQHAEHGDIDLRIESDIWDGNNAHNPRDPDALTN